MAHTISCILSNDFVLQSLYNRMNLSLHALAFSLTIFIYPWNPNISTGKQLMLNTYYVHVLNNLRSQKMLCQWGRNVCRQPPSAKYLQISQTTLSSHKLGELFSSTLQQLLIPHRKAKNVVLDSPVVAQAYGTTIPDQNGEGRQPGKQVLWPLQYHTQLMFRYSGQHLSVLCFFSATDYFQQTRCYWLPSWVHC